MRWFVMVGLMGCSGGGDTEAEEARGTMLHALAGGSGTEACPAGGVLLEQGVDRNANGVLDAGEVAETLVVCNGQRGADGADGQPGPKGDQGEPGDPGPMGAPGMDGASCWDTDLDGVCTPATEDRNVDGVCDATDCTPPDPVVVHPASGDHYVRGASATVQASGEYEVVAECDDNDDLPITGNCSADAVADKNWSYIGFDNWTDTAPGQQRCAMYNPIDLPMAYTLSAEVVCLAMP